MQRRAAIAKPRPRSQAGLFAASNCHSKIGLRSLPLFALYRGFATYPKSVAVFDISDGPAGYKVRLPSPYLGPASTARLRCATAWRPPLAARVIELACQAVARGS